MRGKRRTARRLMANLHCSCPTIGPLQLDSLIFPGREAVPALPSTDSFRPCRSANRQFASVRIPDGKRLVTDGPLTWPRRSARISSVSWHACSVPKTHLRARSDAGRPIRPRNNVVKRTGYETAPMLSKSAARGLWNAYAGAEMCIRCEMRKHTVATTTTPTRLARARSLGSRYC